MIALPGQSVNTLAGLFRVGGIGGAQIQINGSDGFEVAAVGAPTCGQVLTIVDGPDDVDRAMKAAAAWYEARGCYRAMIVD